MTTEKGRIPLDRPPPWRPTQEEIRIGREKIARFSERLRNEQQGRSRYRGSLRREIARHRLSHGCYDCKHRNGAWCDLQGLPCTVNLILSFRRGLIGISFLSYLRVSPDKQGITSLGMDATSLTGGKTVEDTIARLLKVSPNAQERPRAAIPATNWGPRPGAHTHDDFQSAGAILRNLPGDLIVSKQKTSARGGLTES